MPKDSYGLIDSGNQEKWERFGPFSLRRPCAQAVWKRQLSSADWNRAQALFMRDSENQWVKEGSVPDTWTVTLSGITFKVALTDFGHVGLFPEHRNCWEWIQPRIKEALSKRKEVHILNLFAYSGGATLAAAKLGAHVCHLDASKGMVAWAQENAALNGLEKAPIRWIVDDAMKFLKREVRRGRRYDGVVLDPPTFGRGAKGEVFKIEEELPHLLSLCRSLLSETPLFLFLSCHTPGYTPLVLSHLLKQAMPKGSVESGEMVLEGKEGVLPIPSGAFARWC